MTIQTLEPHLIDSLRQSAREILETMVFLTPTAIDAAVEDQIGALDPVAALEQHDLAAADADPAVDHRAASDAGTDGEVHEVAQATAGAEPLLAEGRSGHVRGHDQGCRKARREQAQQIHVGPPGFGGGEDVSVLRGRGIRVARAECSDADPLDGSAREECPAAVGQGGGIVAGGELRPSFEHPVDAHRADGLGATGFDSAEHGAKVAAPDPP